MLTWWPKAQSELAEFLDETLPDTDRRSVRLIRAPGKADHRPGRLSQSIARPADDQNMRPGSHKVSAGT